MVNYFEKIREIIVEQLNVEKSQVKMESFFVKDLGADSLDTVELVMAFEETFNVQIPDHIAEKIVTVKDAVDFISQNKSEKNESKN